MICYDVSTIFTSNFLINDWYLSLFTLKWVVHFRGTGSQKWLGFNNLCIPPKSFNTIVFYATFNSYKRARSWLTLTHDKDQLKFRFKNPKKKIGFLWLKRTTVVSKNEWGERVNPRLFFWQKQNDVHSFKSI
jgi:hypothetical protein